MNGPVFSPLAVQDLDGILQYIAADRPAAAVAFVNKLKDTCNLLAKYPLIGSSREELAKGLRAFSCGSYVIYFRPRGKTVRIERVLHGARDADALFR